MLTAASALHRSLCVGVVLPEPRDRPTVHFGHFHREGAIAISTSEPTRPAVANGFGDVKQQVPVRYLVRDEIRDVDVVQLLLRCRAVPLPPVSEIDVIRVVREKYAPLPLDEARGRRPSLSQPDHRLSGPAHTAGSPIRIGLR
jgi:hypothetical protein